MSKILTHKLISDISALHLLYTLTAACLGDGGNSNSALLKAVLSYIISSDMNYVQ